MEQNLKNYLSMGFGVNSVALYLLMKDLDMDFEALFVDHGGDWPDTYEYAEYFIASGRPVTILKPAVEGFSSLYDYCVAKGMMPSRIKRWCTDKFKVKVLMKHIEKPCFQHIGIDAGEAKRAKIATDKGVENRYLLIEHNIDRAGCVDLIKHHGLKVPRKSGCYFCPFQRKGQWKALRRANDGLWCKAVGIETATNKGREERGKKPIYLYGKDRPLTSLINEKQQALFGMEDIEYPPCQCGL